MCDPFGSRPAEGRGAGQRFIFAAVLSVVIALGVRPAEATTCSYTGNFFSTTYAPHPSSMRISGSFSLDSSLARSTPLTDISGDASLTFSFDAGTVAPFTEADTFLSFSVGTDAAGDVDDWHLHVSGPSHYFFPLL